MIDLHYAATPNGQKIAIMLEEIELPYRLIVYDIFRGDQLDPSFGAINPNHKLPALVDHSPADGGAPLPVMESGAILQYLAEKSGKLLPRSQRERSFAIQWLSWQISALGPMGGQASHFLRYAPEGQDYAVRRYTRELDRLLKVLEGRLSALPYLAGDTYSIADIAVWPGRNASFVLGIDLDLYPATRRWHETIRSRAAVQRVLERPDLAPPAKYLGKQQKLSPEEWSNMFGDRMHEAVRCLD
jgi:GST-like protein